MNLVINAPRSAPRVFPRHARQVNCNDYWVPAHVRARAREGANALENLIPLCNACNNGTGCGPNSANQLDRLWRRQHVDERQKYCALVECVSKLRDATGVATIHSLEEFVRDYYGDELKYGDELCAMLRAHEVAAHDLKQARAIERERALERDRARRAADEANDRYAEACADVRTLIRQHSSLE